MLAEEEWWGAGVHTSLRVQPIQALDQAGQLLLAMGAKEPGAVDRMEAEPLQRRGVAHVMHRRGGDQQVGILGRQDHGRATRLVGTA
jgi:hypothetical protein